LRLVSHGVQGRTRRAPVSAQEAERIAEVMQALATPSRVLLLAQLREGPLSVSQLMAAVGMQQSAVSHQLRLLRDVGLVSGEREGRRVVYSLYDDHVALLIDQAMGHLEHLRLGAAERAGRQAS
jgi:ArsR family transcriptional regulator, nickel/cobalt-responsive transcriptional repressor